MLIIAHSEICYGFSFMVEFSYTISTVYLNGGKEELPSERQILWRVQPLASQQVILHLLLAVLAIFNSYFLALFSGRVVMLFSSHASHAFDTWPHSTPLCLSLCPAPPPPQCLSFSPFHASCQTAALSSSSSPSHATQTPSIFLSNASII